MIIRSLGASCPPCCCAAKEEETDSAHLQHPPSPRHNQQAECIGKLLRVSSRIPAPPSQLFLV